MVRLIEWFSESYKLIVTNKKIGVNQNTINFLDNPGSIFIGYDSKKKAVVIKAAELKVKGSFEFVNIDKNGNYIIMNEKIVNFISHKSNIPFERKARSFEGEILNDKEKMVIFPLNLEKEVANNQEENGEVEKNEVSQQGGEESPQEYENK